MPRVKVWWCDEKLKSGDDDGDDVNGVRGKMIGNDRGGDADKCCATIGKSCCQRRHCRTQQVSAMRHRVLMM